MSGTLRSKLGAEALPAHHQAWLEAHPHRTEGWLREKLREGFDVHHVDGDHANNAPANLCLIEHTDHMRLHGISGLGRLGPVSTRVVRRRGPIGFETQAAAYEAVMAGSGRRTICKDLGLTGNELDRAVAAESMRRRQPAAAVTAHPDFTIPYYRTRQRERAAT